MAKLNQLVLRSVAGLALLTIGGNAPAWGQSTYICQYEQLLICSADLGCTSEGSEEIDLPRVVKIDISSGELSGMDDAGNLRQAKAANIQENEGIYFFQAAEETRKESGNVVGWTVFLDSKSLRLSGSAVNDDVIFNVFGSCQAE